VQLAAVRTQEEALAVAAKAKREYAAALAAREPEIDQAVFGNMGAFYRVRVGPFATVQETEAVCARLKGSGFDCMSVTR
jgi:cell division septation protein DedD